MTTPLCNAGCEENIGWLPETSWDIKWPKSTAQSIYCVGGLPVVPPRGLFQSNWGDAREDSFGTGRSLGSSGSVANLSGATSASLVVSNTTGYTMDMFAIWTGNAELNILGTAVYKFETKAFKDNVNVSTATTYEYGNGAVTNGWRYMKNEAWKHVGQLAPGTAATFTVKTTWSLFSGAASGSVMNRFGSALRVITGNTL